MLVVYISSPYSIGDKQENVKRQMYYSNLLIDAGMCPITPLLNHYQNELYPQEYDKWLSIDIELVRRADVVLRLSGESYGADAEEVEASANGIPICYNVEELLQFKQLWDMV
jgi:hypothetical protein